LVFPSLITDLLAHADLEQNLNIAEASRQVELLLILEGTLSRSDPKTSAVFRVLLFFSKL
jgi:hypothetical protein